MLTFVHVDEGVWIVALQVCEGMVYISVVGFISHLYGDTEGIQRGRVRVRIKWKEMGRLRVRDRSKRKG
jgi:hypothetical protein